MPAGDPPKSSKDFNTAPTGDNKKQQSKPRAANQGSNPGGSSRNISRAQEVSALVAQQATRNVQSSTVMHSRILQREIDERRVWEELKASIRRSLAALSEASSGDSVVTFGGRKLIVVVCWLPISLDWDSDSSNITGHHDDPSGCEYAKSLIAPAKPALRCRSVVIVGSVKIRDVKSDQWLDEPYSDDMQTAVREYLDPLGYRAVMTPSDRSRGLLPNDFADSIIFRLFHYLTPPPPETGFHSTQDWASYVDVNTVYSDTIAELYQTGDVVSVHGYSLMLVPEILRKQRNLNEMFIGFHFHTVFPSSEIYRCFPQRAQLLRGVLSADIISLQSFQYARHFFMACTRVLGVECTASSGIIEPSEETGGTRTKVVSIPMGINPLPLRALQQKPEVIEHVKSMRETFANKKIILGIDKLNGRRGIPHKLLAFHKLLTRKPELRSKCVWIEVCDPTGTGESEQDLLKQVYQIAGEINGSFGTFESVPVHLLIQPFDMSELVPLYEVADVIVDTSLRDVMATSACEYLACNHKDGVLVLSEFSGSATSLRAAATTVNPWDITRFSEGIYDALTMDDEERIERHCYGANHVSRHTEAEWGRRLLQEFADAREEAETQKTWMIPEKLGQDDVVSSIRSSARVLIVTGYQGTLGARPSAELRVLPERRVTPVSDYELQTLESLGHDEMTDVVVVSSLSRHDLGAAGLVSDLPINVLAENGAWLRTPGSDWVCTVEPDVDISWLPAVQSIMEYFVDRTPGSYIDRTDFSVAWHYPKSGSQASGDHCETQTRDMMIHLWAGPLCSTAADIVVGNNSLEVRAVSVNKAEKLDAVLQSWGRTYDTVLVLGDFIARDEDIYTVVNKYATSAVLRKESDLSVDSTGLSGGSTLSDMDHEGSTNPEFNPGVFACTVGKHGTRAAYHLADCHDVAFLLAKCAWALANRTSSPIATSATGKEEEALDARDEADEELPRTATISAHP